MTNVTSSIQNVVNLNKHCNQLLKGRWNLQLTTEIKNRSEIVVKKITEHQQFDETSAIHL